MPPHAGIHIAFGGGVFGHEGGAFATEAEVSKLLDKLEQHGVKIIDTAEIYAETKSESLLGSVGASKRFTIDTKHPGSMGPGTLTEEGVVKKGIASLERLKTDKVNVYYIHGPDPSASVASYTAGFNELYKRGAFTHFGLSNFSAQQVQEVYDHCKENNYPLPTVYQGNYNPVARKYEQELFPTLRKLGIAFYAYSPLAGGFLTKTKKQVLDGAGRFDTSNFLGQMYSALYAQPTLLEALAEWEQAAKDEGVGAAELAYRWVTFNSTLLPEHGDAIIFGARNLEQTEETLGWLKKGPVSDTAEKAIDRIWELVKDEAPVDNLAALSKLQQKS